jgi:hypothetical protein
VTPADDPHTVDRRGVHQLIRDSEVAARQLLHNPGLMAAPAMLRAWPELVESATQLWQALPTPGPVEPVDAGTPATADRGDAVMERLDAMAIAWHRSLIRGGWPGNSRPADERLLRIAENLNLAEERLLREPLPARPGDTPLDPGAARTLLMSTLYVGAHAITVALQLHHRDLRAAMAGKDRLPFGESLEATRHAQHRMAAFETLAGSLVARTHRDGTQPLVGEPGGGGRLAVVLARWDIQAHRTLATSTSTADLMYASRTEQAVTALSHLILRAGAATGALDPEQYRERLSPAVSHVEAAWAGAAKLWGQLTPRTDRIVEPDLLAAGEQAVAALRELAHNGATIAAPELMANRTDLRAEAQTLQQSLSASSDLACLIRDTVSTGALVGDARGIGAILARRLEPGFDVDPVDAEAWAVNPWAAPTTAPIRVPPPVRDALAVTADRVLEATAAAMNAGAFLDRTPSAAPADDPPAMGWERGNPIPQLDTGPANPGFDR